MQISASFGGADFAMGLFGFPVSSGSLSTNLIVIAAPPESRVPVASAPRVTASEKDGYRRLPTLFPLLPHSGRASGDTAYSVGKVSEDDNSDFITYATC